MLHKLTTREKAYKLNQDPAIYGTFAEIGAGQEVARNFFQAGGASSTIAKTISAYDMVFSDSIYGAEDSKRYVCESRLVKMMDHEYNLLRDRLSEKRPSDTTFFAFADTVAAKSYKSTRDCHGWLGIRFQATPQGPYNDIALHVRMLDQRNFLQAEAIGMLGVNLIYGAFYQRDNPEELIDSLMDGLDQRRIEIDAIKFSGPDVKHVDNRLMGLRLVELGHTRATLFLPDGTMDLLGEALYGKSVVIQRGSFRPFTKLSLDMLECGISQFKHQEGVDPKTIQPVLEIHMDNLMSGGKVDKKDFLARIDLISSLGYPVLISNFPEYFQLVAKLKQSTLKPIAAIVGVGHVPEIFNEQHFRNYEGGLLETLGKLFNGGRVKVLVYPAHTLSVTQPAFCPVGEEDTLFTAENFETPTHLDELYKWFVQNGLFHDLTDYNPDVLKIDSREVLKQIQSGNKNWEAAVPPTVAKTIKAQGLFGWKN